MSTEGEAWDRYWAGGNLHSCTGAFSGNYDGSVRSLWEGLFAELPDAAVIVDIGTGNGAVPLIGLEYSDREGRGFRLNGVDLADIDPASRVQAHEEALSRIRFHPRTSADRMPFESGSVDAVTGLYALEYTPLPATLAEIARILRSDGRACFVIHHTRSVVLETAAEEAGHLDAVLATGGFLDAARELLTVLSRARTPAQRKALARDPLAERRRQAFNAAAAALNQRLEAARERDALRSALGGVAHALQEILARSGPEAAGAELDRLEAEFRANRERLADLSRAACDSQRLQALTREAEAVGLTADAPELLRHDADRLLGWVWRLHPAP